MEQVIEIGLNHFVRLKKLRVEHLNPENSEQSMTSFTQSTDEVYKKFLLQLSENQTISFIKIERVFTNDTPRR